jgi:type II secretory ATPase GspE/PulE/Tfp pilus assembly ATPase PilB-like protein
LLNLEQKLREDRVALRQARELKNKLIKMSQTINDLFTDENQTSDASLKLESKLDTLKVDSLEEETQEKASSLNLKYINLKGIPIIPEALSLMEEDHAKNLGAVCFYLSDDVIKVGTTGPDNPQLKKLINELASEQDKKIDIFLISEKSLEHALKLYSALPKIIEIKEGVEIKEEDLKKYEQKDLSFDKIAGLLKEADISEIITIIIATALQVDSSDIHIEAEEKDIKVRLRIDGVLHVVASLSGDIWSKIISRIKLISKLKINVVERPQDGRFTIHLGKEDVDVRVSTIPTKYGESVVMRLLKASATSLEFDGLGIKGKSFVELKKQIKRPNGMIITTGPTGSGKTTTLYAILKKLNSPENKIITLEDPIEYRLAGVNQSQVRKDKDYSFASGLKSILRQDPDIVMVGEIRDLETADVAINASLTGHLVISTLHTNSASAAIPRFLAMGVKSFLLSPSLNAIIGQRLVRRICPHCKEEDNLDNDVLTEVMNIMNKIPKNSGSSLDDEELNNLKFYKGKGCDKCHGLGYKGRVGVYEILVMSKEIEKTILDNQVSENIIQELAQKNGMVTMLQDGLLKAKEGLTTVEEIFNVAD